MNKIFITLLFYFITCIAHCQEITGDWNGALKVQGIQLKLVFHIDKSESGYSATMDIPDQGAAGLKVSSVIYRESSLELSIANLSIEYKGMLGQDGIIDGTFTQNGMAFPLKLTKEEIYKEEVRRPQEPLKPYPYVEEEVVFENRKAGIKLAGTLTLPNSKGVFPAVVLISGSGAQNRDEELMGHKPFLVIADYLTHNGIAVLRYDDRGTAASEGDFSKATTADLTTDAEAAFDYLKTRKEIKSSQIGLAGHSEGGIIAPAVAAQRPDDIAFVIMLAGVGIRGDSLLLLQSEMIQRAYNIDEQQIQSTLSINRSFYEMISDNADSAALRSALEQEIAKNKAITGDMSAEVFIGTQIKQLLNPWVKYILKYDPAQTLIKVKCPVMILNGERDVQVPAKINTEAISRALAQGGNRNVSVKIFPRLNHLFQECQTGLPAEYSAIEQTFSPEVLDEIARWILATCANY
ncbi:MAG: alpha/beta hydrolase [Bacteroidales bacterium]|jgi:pimeloyl-ACP methyl ester carboxylesterase|nr:alpha/beta hydrolase [Bacteroidales bacterium]